MRVMRRGVFWVSSFVAESFGGFVVKLCLSQPLSFNLCRVFLESLGLLMHQKVVGLYIVYFGSNEAL